MNSLEKKKEKKEKLWFAESSSSNNCIFVVVPTVGLSTYLLSPCSHVYLPAALPLLSCLSTCLLSPCSHVYLPALPLLSCLSTYLPSPCTHRNDNSFSTVDRNVSKASQLVGKWFWMEAFCVLISPKWPKLALMKYNCPPGPYKKHYKDEATEILYPLRPCSKCIG